MNTFLRLLTVAGLAFLLGCPSGETSSKDKAGGSTKAGTGTGPAGESSQPGPKAKPSSDKGTGTVVESLPSK